jgi:hypothetical protein
MWHAWEETKDAKRIRVDEMKVQIRDLTKESTREVTVSFFNDLDTRKELCSGLRVQSPDLCFIF